MSDVRSAVRALADHVRLRACEEMAEPAKRARWGAMGDPMCLTARDMLYGGLVNSIVRQILDELDLDAETRLAVCEVLALTAKIETEKRIAERHRERRLA